MTWCALAALAAIQYVVRLVTERRPSDLSLFGSRVERATGVGYLEHILPQGYKRFLNSLMPA